MRSRLTETVGLRGIRMAAYVVLTTIALWICVTWVSNTRSQRNDPVYEGRPLSSWVQELVPLYPPETRLRAKDAVRAIGTNGLPLMLEYLSERDKSFSEVLSETWK